MTLKLKQQVFLATAVFLALVLNHAIYAKEQVIAHGDTVLLELAPVDPRSLMQGDYMRLAYKIERDLSRDKDMQETVRAQPKRGHMIVRPDADNVALFVRFYDPEHPPLDGEKLLRYHKRDNSTWIEIVPRSFMFQEGHRKVYEAAKYGIFKFDDAGERVLTGMADKDRVRIEPPQNKDKDKDTH